MSKFLDIKNDNVGAVLNCAVRYSCGRKTYMPSIVVGVIRPNVSELNDKTLCCMERDIEEKGRFGGYGDECNKAQWMKLLNSLTEERKSRGLERWS